jgi:hypothetical protein
MLNFRSFLPLFSFLEYRLVGIALILAAGWGGLSFVNATTKEQLMALKAQYPLAQQWQSSQQCPAKAWKTLQQGTGWTRARLKVVVQFLLQQFNLDARQIKIEEAPSVGLLKMYPISVVAEAMTDAEIFAFLAYIETELFPIVSIKRFSLHRSQTLDESMLQDGTDSHLIEGRIDLVWTSK